MSEPRCGQENEGFSDDDTKLLYIFLGIITFAFGIVFKKQTASSKLK